MQDPSYGVPQQLVHHVHLISGHKYPYIPSLGIDQAFHYLFEAPKIVKQHAPMCWQYLTAPSDGTVFLTWQNSRTGGQFPTDGYVWAGQEEHLMQEFGGYTVEIAIQHSGFRPGQDQMSCHTRRRYRLVSKNPQVAAVPPDPNLWIVHYSQSEQHKVMPIQHVQITQYIQQQMQERRLIEQQGRLERQDFMLHDREKWPHLRLSPRGMQPGQMYGQNFQGQNPMPHVGNPRFSGQFYQQPQAALAGPSPAKRQRQHPPTQIPGVISAPAVQDTSIEDEENVLVGDLLDYLTHRDISLTRYMQHHEWMEEVFSSPYATGQIVPVELGFGLMGELSGLTEGIFKTVSSAQEKAQNAESVSSYNKVQPEQLKDFEKRVSNHLAEGQAELQRMKDEHEQRMQELRRSKILSRAERRLRTATWENGKGAADFNVNGDGRHEDIEAVTEEVEILLGVTIQPQKEATLVEKGGLREKVRPPPEPVAPPANGGLQDLHNDAPAGLTHVLDNQDGLVAAQTSGQPSATSQVSSSVMTQNPQAMDQASVHQMPPQPHQQQPQQPSGDQNEAPLDDISGLENMDNIDDMDNLDNIDSIGADMSMIDDMDLDVEGTDLNFDTGDQEQQQTKQQQDWTITQESNNNPGNDNSGNNNNSINNPIPQGGNPTLQNNDPSAQQSNDLFGNTEGGTFDDFDAGDGLIDFEGGEGEAGLGTGDDMGLDLGMDTSAFGDAFHDTEGNVGDAGDHVGGAQ